MVDSNSQKKIKRADILEFIIKNIPQGIAILDRDLNLVYTNSALTDILGVGLKKLDTKFPEYLNALGESKGEVARLIRQFTETDDRSFFFTVTTERGFTYRITLVRINSGHSEYQYMLLIQDITKEMEMFMHQTLIKQHKYLENISAILFHKLNNNLMTILSEAELIHRRIPPNQRQYVDDVFDNLEEHLIEISEFVNLLASFMRVELKEKVEFNPIKVLKDILKNISEKQALGHIVQFDAPAEDVIVKGEPKAFEVAIKAILDNAIRSISGKGRIVINVETITADTYFLQRYSELKPGEYLKISIADTGIGIPKSFMSRIFEPFFSGWSQPSKGLGLPTALTAIRRNSGTIDIQSFPGVGTTVTILLPLETKVIPTRQPVIAKGKLILVIDDDSLVRETVSRMLSALGFEVECAKNFSDGMKKFRDRKPSVVLLDIVMPDSPGDEVFYELKKVSPDVPIVIMTGYAQIDTVEKLLDAGAAGILNKPFTMEDLSEAINLAIEDSGGV